MSISTNRPCMQRTVGPLAGSAPEEQQKSAGNSSCRSANQKPHGFISGLSCYRFAQLIAKGLTSLPAEVQKANPHDQQNNSQQF